MSMRTLWDNTEYQEGGSHLFRLLPAQVGDRPCMCRGLQGCRPAGAIRPYLHYASGHGALHFEWVFEVLRSGCFLRGVVWGRGLLHVERDYFALNRWGS